MLTWKVGDVAYVVRKFGCPDTYIQEIKVVEVDDDDFTVVVEFTPPRSEPVRVSEYVGALFATPEAARGHALRQLRGRLGSVLDSLVKIQAAIADTKAAIAILEGA